ncbi:MAG: bifunctional 23S rRNA (guanine(2069)-N(7))-methyltransferase RlmK/23S rRNA (guanine(2445)-N(2))-methyltransferase RlmL [Halioglobus sp.]|nr:bifunctional 23S rRNA (guanine(2069)-N(7))-methyltransferase RlmK/23S rRNA (guanine(2445)-N(2))-methyltransferase RlmL [Halioglobus sp.]
MTAAAQPQWFATCPKGVEPLLADELQQLGASTARQTVAGVHFTGAWSVAYRACLWSRLANRILWPLQKVAAGDADALYRGLREMDWNALFDPAARIAVDFSGSNREIRNTQFGAQRSKDAIADHFTAAVGRRPDVDRSHADVRINVRLARGSAQVAIDLSGGSLHQRGYRRGAGAAPLKENLAAAILLRADWPAMAARGGALIDPMCGSGTLLIEAGMMAADIAPGLGRRRFGFEKLRVFDHAQWQALTNEADSRAQQGRARQLPEIRGYDASAKMVQRAMDNIGQAGLAKQVRVSARPLSDLKRPTHRPLATGLIVTNPPYGERLGDKSQLHDLYALLGRRMLEEFPGWQAAVFTSEEALARATGLRSHKRYTLYNGALETGLYLFDLGNNELRERERPAGPGRTAAGELTPGAAMFANRLRKNRRRLAPWASRQGIECYRLYDADMPEYSVAVDIYGERVHVAEYKAPPSVDEAAAGRRMDEVRAALPEALEVPAHSIVYKERARQRGSAQYERRSRRGEFLPVREGQATLLVNLHDYLDTGLFLDHRPLRLRIAAEAKDRDFLNLFCYTGSATIHAALGGARSTTSVDKSNTYLDWLRRNLALNELPPERNHVVRDDCLRWLQQCDGSFDLILLDPPSFSNTRSSGDNFDVQRDHEKLVRAAMARLRPGGVLYFSNNRRGFRLAPELARDFACEDITGATLDRDFERNRRIHQCWRLGHPATS